MFLCLVQRTSPPYRARCPGHGRAFGSLAAAFAAPIQHGQLAAIFLQHDFGRIFLHPVLVGVFAGLELAFDIDLRALLQILLGHLRKVLVEDHHAVPLGLLLAFSARLVAPGFRGRDREIDHRIARSQPPHFRVAPQIADQDHLVDAARHPHLSFA